MRGEKKSVGLEGSYTREWPALIRNRVLSQHLTEVTTDVGKNVLMWAVGKLDYFTSSLQQGHIIFLVLLSRDISVYSCIQIIRLESNNTAIQDDHHGKIQDPDHDMATNPGPQNPFWVICLNCTYMLYLRYFLLYVTIFDRFSLSLVRTFLSTVLLPPIAGVFSHD